eukprot:COSAG02_NODE_723_length_18041_cov_7.464720_5_plen_53_part_00
MMVRTDAVTCAKFQFASGACGLLTQAFRGLSCLGDFQHPFRGQLSYLCGTPA